MITRSLAKLTGGEVFLRWCESSIKDSSALKMQYPLNFLGTIVLIFSAHFVECMRMSPPVKSKMRRNVMEMVATDKESPSQPHLNTRENPMTEKFEVISFHHLECS